MSRRRRSRTTFDARVIPLVGAIALLAYAYYNPGFALLMTAALATVAVAVWYVGARRRLQDLHRWGSVSNMFELSPEGFERHVADTYAALGYTVKITRRVGDQGIDVLAERGTERLGIQCKRTTESVSNSAVQEAYAGKAHYQCTAAAVVSLGGFTSSARSLASSTGVVLLDGPAYADLFHRATANLPKRSVWNILPHRRTVSSAGVLMLVAVLMLAIGVAGVTSPHQNMIAVGQNLSQPTFASPSDAVQRFYEAVNERRLADAYALLSPSFKGSMTFAQFRAGYETTLGVSATTNGNPSGSTVTVHLVATDRNHSGSTRTTVYDGYWKVVPDGRGGWLLDDGRFRRV